MIVTWSTLNMNLAAALSALAMLPATGHATFWIRDYPDGEAVFRHWAKDSVGFHIEVHPPEEPRQVFIIRKADLSCVATFRLDDWETKAPTAEAVAP